MSKNLNNYLMKPTYLKRIPIYPIKIMDYEEFSQLANQYILLDIPQLNNKLKQLGNETLPFKTLFEYLVGVIEDEYKLLEQIKKEFNKNSNKKIPNKELVEMIREKYNLNSEVNICKLLNMTLHKDISFNRIMKCFAITDKGKIIGVINDDNFYEYRKIVMEQNLLFTPRIAPNKKSQEIIDKEIKKLFGDEEFSLETIIGVVSMEYGGKDISDFTYYRVKSDYKIAMLKLNYMSSIIYKANGCKGKGDSEIPVPSLSEDLNMLENPYNNVLKKAKTTELDKQLMNR